MFGAIIGFGTIAQGHLYAYQQKNNMKIVAIVDKTESRCSYAKQMHIHAYTSFEEMITHEDIDFVDICTPPDSHYQYILKGVNAGCHVLFEKPFLLQSAQYQELFTLQKNKGTIVYPSMNYKFSPAMQIMRDTVKTKQFGKIYSAHFRTIRSGHAQGIKAWNPNWRRDFIISGGGILQDHGPHSIYLACELFGDYPVAVSCISGKMRDEQYDTEDTALLYLYFANGTQFMLDISWAAEYRNTYYEVHGSKESMLIENDHLTYITANGNIKNIELASDFNDSSHKQWFPHMFDHFYDVVDNCRNSKELLWEAFMTTEIIEKSYLSAAMGGKRIELDNTMQGWKA